MSGLWVRGLPLSLAAGEVNYVRISGYDTMSGPNYSFTLTLTIGETGATSVSTPIQISGDVIVNSCDLAQYPSLLNTVGLSGPCADLLSVNRESIRTAVQNGSLQVTSQDGQSYELSQLYTANITDMSRLLMRYSSASPLQGIGSWDVSNVTNMDEMFFDASAFNQNIGNWSVSNVTDMNGMFRGATAFNQNISNWNVCNVMYYFRAFFNSGMQFRYVKSTCLWTAPT